MSYYLTPFSRRSRTTRLSKMATTSAIDARQFPERMNIFAAASKQHAEKRSALYEKHRVLAAINPRPRLPVLPPQGNLGTKKRRPSQSIRHIAFTCQQAVTRRLPERHNPPSDRSAPSFWRRFFRIRIYSDRTGSRRGRPTRIPDAPKMCRSPRAAVTRSNNLGMLLLRDYDGEKDDSLDPAESGAAELPPAESARSGEGHRRSSEQQTALQKELAAGTTACGESAPCTPLERGRPGARGCRLIGSARPAKITTAPCCAGRCASDPAGRFRCAASTCSHTAFGVPRRVVTHGRDSARTRAMHDRARLPLPSLRPRRSPPDRAWRSVETFLARPRPRGGHYSARRPSSLAPNVAGLTK